MDEPHRSSTPLELLFDLTFVVAVGLVAAQFAHAIEQGHAVRAVVTYLMVFFAIWWAWMNFTWFASGYDTDDVAYRIFTMVQMGGVLVLAAGVPAGFGHGDFRSITIGYLIMRAGLVALWIRAALEDPGNRRGPVRNAVGFSVVQVGWLLRLLLPAQLTVPSVLVLALLDMAVPLWAARAGAASWNARHIAERYGLFTIILLGESLLAATTAVQDALQSAGANLALFVVAGCGLVVVFAMWWLYFLEPSGEGLERRPRLAYLWGYAHFGIFAALGALSAGLEFAVLETGHHLKVPDWTAGVAVALPVGIYLVLLWAVHAPLVAQATIRPAVMLAGAALVLLSPLATGFIGTTGVVVAVAAICAAIVGVTVLRRR